MSDALLNTYTEVALDSVGKLGCPKILHFRNYTVGEIYDLAVADDRSNLQTLIGCLNNMVKEDFDCRKLHHKDFLTILLTIHATWWGSTVTKKFYRNPNIENPEKLNSPDNIITEAIPISAYATKPLDEKFKTPFKIDYANKTGVFRTLTIGDTLDADDYLRDIYFQKERELSDLLGKVEAIKQEGDSTEKMQSLYAHTTVDERKQYFEYQKLLDKTKRMYLQACCLLEFDGKKFKTAEEKMKAIDQVPIPMWSQYNKVSLEYDFGIDEQVTFESEKLGETITRRLGFRLYELVPGVDTEPMESGSVRFD